MAQCKINFKKLPVVFLAMIIIATAFVITGCGKTVVSKEIDAFKGFNLTYIGDNGEIYAFEDTSGCDKLVKEADIYFTVEAENNGFLKNGDKITVIADSHKNLEEEGYFLKEKSKEFVVLALEATRKTLEGVDFTSIASQMLYEVNAYTETDFDLVCFLDCKFESGKKRELDTDSFNFTKQLDFLNYAYSYDPSDYSNKNCFIAFYKLTVDIDCINDQYSGSNSDPDLMKKGEKDTGVCYIAVQTYADVTVSEDNKLVNPNGFYSIVDGPTIEDCVKALEIDSYTTTEYFDANYKKIDTSATESVTETATKDISEIATEPTT